jgi:polyisoprenoid-binding protein YceI
MEYDGTYSETVTWLLGQFLSAEGSFRFDEQTGELSDLIVNVDTESVTTQHSDAIGICAAATF